MSKIQNTKQKTKYAYTTKKGLNNRVVENISYQKKEPQWMRDFRLKSYEIFKRKPMPTWGADLSDIDFNDIHYYMKATEGPANTWDELPKEIRETYEKIGIPRAEKDYLAGVSSQFECLTGDALIFGNPQATKIKDIKPGMSVYALNETTRQFEKQKVLGLSHKEMRPVYKLKVAGRRIKCTQNHPFLVMKYHKEKGKQRGKFSVKWDYLKNLSTKDYIAIAKDIPDTGKPYKLPSVSFQKTYKGKNQFKSFTVKADWLYTRNQKQLKIPFKTSSDLLWLFGLYLGDGYITRTEKNGERKVLSIAIPQTQKELRQKLAKTLKNVFGYILSNSQDFYRVRIPSIPIARLFKLTGLEGNAHTKKLPAWIFTLPKSQKLALIGGYIDSDGYLRNNKKACDVWITSVNKKLLQSVQMLGISCGLHVTGIYKFYSGFTNKNNKRIIGYRLQISGDLLPLTKDSLKVKKGWSPRKYYHTYGTHHGSPLTNYISDKIGFAKIQEILPAGKEDVYDIEVDRHHNFIANGIIVHNSEVVYESLREDLEKQGVLFCDTDTALKKYPDIFKQYFSSIVPPADNKFAALNSAVWSGGSFIYIPKGVKVEFPLQAYFHIQMQNMGQFERTLIIADEGSYVHYLEGCSAPLYSSNSLHSAVVEIIVKPGARFRYTTIQNWSNNVYNLVTKRAVVEKEGFMDWIDCNLGSRVTMKYPGFILKGKGARGEMLSVAIAGKGQHQDTGAKAIHLAPYTSSRIISKSISKNGGRTSYRGLVHIIPGAKKSNVYVSCNGLIIDEKSRSDTYPTMKVKEKDVCVQHEAQVERLSEEKLFYLTSRGIKQEEAQGMLVNGFIKPITKEIPLEYAVEMNRLINLEMEGSVG